MSCSGFPCPHMHTPPKPLVLLVEDEPMVRWTAHDGLEDGGYEVVEAENAAQALQILETRDDVGVLFTDVNMPGPMDGLALAELVHARWPEIRLVITSGRGLAGRLPAAGRFLTKPYSVGDLADTIERTRGKD